MTADARRGRSLIRCIAALVLALALQPLGAQPAATAIPVANAGFEDGAPGEAPPGWAGNALGDSGPYRARIDADNPREGRASLRLEHAAAAVDPQVFGTLTARVDAAPYRGRRVRLVAAVRTDTPAGGHVGLWFRVDRADGRRGFFDNMQDRPIRSAAWADYVVEGDVAADACGPGAGAGTIPPLSGSGTLPARSRRRPHLRRGERRLHHRECDLPAGGRGPPRHHHRLCARPDRA